MVLGAPAPLEPFRFLPAAGASPDERALPEPLAGFMPGLQVQHLAKGNFPPQPVQTWANSHLGLLHVLLLNDVHGNLLGPDHLTIALSPFLFLFPPLFLRPPVWGLA